MDYKKFYKTLDIELIESLKWYTKTGYKLLNKNTREGKKLSSDQQQHFNNIREIFNEIPTVSTSITVYRGLKLIKPDDFKIFDKGFVSTSIDENVAKNFSDSGGCCILVITILPGSPVLYLQSISDVPDEEEILLDSEVGLFTLLKTEKKERTYIYVSYSGRDIKKATDSNIQKNLKKISDTEIIKLLTKYLKDDQKDEDFRIDINNSSELYNFLSNIAKNFGIEVTPIIQQKVLDNYKTITKKV